MTAHAGTDVAAMGARAVAVRELFARRAADASTRPWTTEEVMLGFVGDVGDLAKLVQGKEGVRERADLDAALAHELADCLWSVLVLADAYDVDLPAAFDATMDDLTARLSRDAAPGT
ncbi:MazG nucleotide pyrophosphohydrolase domain-containing protein [Cellulomonas sp. B6]|uniref:MazG nucleotide pyrophosphohydrolase domain-containing protein n=1 Tax=Cellulomonas sp. B6 TaxID=1295626 RepID=UPI001CBC7137|nr:MazG nucleotide pyrophosphohydrolase domain-containing protein [Cellulomonas sp. B6]